MVPVDSQGTATGPVRRLTSPAGHVSAYDIEAEEPTSGSGSPSLLLVARDDGEAIDGSGGVLLRVRVTAEAVDPPVAIAADGLGRGAPSFVSAARAAGPPGGSHALAVAWIASGEQSRLILLDAAGAPTAAPSAEDDLGDARALLFIGAGGVPSSRASATSPSLDALDALIATPADSAAQLRVFACRR
jgi:hypothetical protein